MTITKWSLEFEQFFAPKFESLSLSLSIVPPIVHHYRPIERPQDALLCVRFLSRVAVSRSRLDDSIVKDGERNRWKFRRFSFRTKWWLACSFRRRENRRRRRRSVLWQGAVARLHSMEITMMFGYLRICLVERN